MTKHRNGTPLQYNVFKLPLPVSAWNLADKGSMPSEAHRLISQFKLSKSVVFCHPSSAGVDNIGAKLFNNHKSHSLRLSSVRLSALCNAQFIKQILLPYKLRICSFGERLSDGYRFSLSFDDGLHLQVSNDGYNVLGLSNNSEMHRHKDGYVTTRMDVVSAAYLKEGSKLHNRTITALNRLTPCDAIAASAFEFDHKSLHALFLDCGSSECTVHPLTSKVCTAKTVGDAESTILCQDKLISSINDILERGKLQEQVEAPVSMTCNVPNGGRDSAGAKRRKVLSSEDLDDGLEEDFDVLLQHKELLFKAHRTLSQDKNKKLDTLCNVMRELDAKVFHKFADRSIIHRIRHTIDDLVFRSIVSSSSSVTTLKPHKGGSEFSVSVSTGGYTTDNSLFEIFRSSCEHFNRGLLPVFILCATATRTPAQNMHMKELRTAPSDHHLYIISCSHPSDSEELMD